LLAPRRLPEERRIAVDSGRWSGIKALKRSSAHSTGLLVRTVDRWRGRWARCARRASGLSTR
jgi:hypothetical protein